MPEDNEAKDTEKKAARPVTDEVEAAEAEAAPEESEPVPEPPEDEPDPPEDDPDPERSGDERGLFGRFTRKLRDRRELTDDAWKAMGAVISTSDKAKSDFVRMLGRELRHYLDGLQLTDDLKDLVTSHSLEVHASLSLKPLVKDDDDEEAETDE